MPYDADHAMSGRGALRLAVLRLMAQSQQSSAMSEDDYRAALRAAIHDTQDHASKLWDAYRGGRPDGLEETYARYGY